MPLPTNRLPAPATRKARRRAHRATVVPVMTDSQIVDWLIGGHLEGVTIIDENGVRINHACGESRQSIREAAGLQESMAFEQLRRRGGPTR